MQGSGNWTLIENINANSVELLGLLACSTYEIQLASICDTVQGEWTNSFILNTEGCCVNPNVYSVPNAQGATTATVAWNDIFAADGYTIQLTGPNGTDIIQSLQPNITFFNLDSCTTYTIQVASICVNPENPLTSFEFSTTGCGSCTDIVYCDADGGNAADEYIGSGYGGFIHQHQHCKCKLYRLHRFEYAHLSCREYLSCVVNSRIPRRVVQEYFKIWIDYNANGTFDEPMELAFDAGSGSQNTVTGNITIPISLALSEGSTRMRVGMAYVGIFGSGNPPTSCGTYAYGEVEDYCVNLQLADGVENLNGNFNLQVYPNPAKESIQLNLPSNIQKSN